MPRPTLITARLVLRPFTLDDAPAYYAKVLRQKPSAAYAYLLRGVACVGRPVSRSQCRWY